MPKVRPDTKLYIVRLYNVVSGKWKSITEPLDKIEAYKIWIEKTGGCNHHTKFSNDTEYYDVYPVEALNLIQRK